MSSFCLFFNFTWSTLSDTLEGPGPIRVFWGTLMGLAREGGGTMVMVDILSLLLEAPTEICTVCPRSSDPFYIATYYTKWVTTSWAYSKIHAFKLFLGMGIGMTIN